jgi:diketogulonate reductase-like aldo/keto reductase
VKKRVFGWTKETLPVVGQGTWQMEGDDRARCVETLRAGLDAGMTHVDTAEMYGTGRVEEIVAEAIAGRRDEIFLVSKVLPSNASRAGTIRACEASLKRLRTDRLDLYLLHWPGEHPLEGTIAAFEELKAAGKIRQWGVSNFDVADLDEALSIAGEKRIACNQVLYHPAERGIEHAVIPWCAKHDVAVVAYSPFGSGPLPGPRTSGGRALAEVAKAHGTTPHAVALAFLLRLDGVFVIPKTTDPAHARDNAAAADLALTRAEIASLEKAFPRGPKPRSLPTI